MEGNDIKNNTWFEIAKSLSLITQLGIIVLVCIFGCGYIGIRIDRALDCSPLFFAIFTLLGIGSAFVSLHKTLKSYFKKGK